MKQGIYVVVLTFVLGQSYAHVDRWDYDQSSWTVLMKLAYNNDTIGVAKFVKLGISINLKNEAGWTALKVATKKGLSKTVKFLLRNGADPNLSDKKLMTPLMEASLHNELQIAEMLLRRGADPNRRNVSGWTALMGATSFGGIQLMELLVGNGANIHIKRTVDRYTALALARHGKDQQKIDYLIGKGAE